MGRNVAVGSVVVFAILVGALTMCWFREAGQFKEHVEQQIKRLNILALKEGQEYITGLDFISYSDIETYGYPLSVELSFRDMQLKSLIANPRVEGIVLRRELLSDVVGVHYDNLSITGEEGVTLNPKLKPEIIKILDGATAGKTSDLEAFNQLMSALREHFRAEAKK